MAQAEGAFKAELRSSFINHFGVTVPLVSLSDKITVGLSDLLLIQDRTYAMEVKKVQALPKRKTTNLLKHPFTPKQIRFMNQVDLQPCGVGLGIIGLPDGDAMLVSAKMINVWGGNVSLEMAEDYYRSRPEMVMRKKGKFWDIKKILEYTNG
jgi:hypothetical protein